MSPGLAKSESCLEPGIRFSYFVKQKTGKPSRVGTAKVLDISEAGLCMEISPLDSDLFVESNAARPSFNRDIELQIYCRSHPRNIFLEGTVRWFKHKGDLSLGSRPHNQSAQNSANQSEALGICAGVVFSLDDPEKKREIEQLLGRIDSRVTSCRRCLSPVSAEGSFCYECGCRIISRREALRAVLNSVLAEGDPGRELPGFRDSGDFDCNI